MTVTIYIWRPGRHDINARPAALLHSFEDAQPTLYDLPDGWQVAKSVDGEDVVFDNRGNGCDLVVQGSGVCAVNASGVTWLRRTGSTQGDALRLARQEAGMNMRQLAEAAGVSLNTVSLIEAGKSAPRADVLKALATALGTSMDALWD